MNKNTFTFLFILSGIAIVAGLLLSFISYLNVCTNDCNALHSYRLYGFTFESIAFLFFPLCLLSYVLSLKFGLFNLLTASLLVAATAAELVFIYIQKYLASHFCPICLSIASMVFIATLCYLLNYLRGDSMLKKSITLTTAAILGFMVAFFGIGKMDELKAAENSMQQRLIFGHPAAAVDVFFFSDWQCPACRQVEANLEEIVKAATKKGKLTFVDFTIHPSSLNFTPYNLSFLLNNKSKYVQLRDALTKLSTETDAPTDEQVEGIAKSLGLHYKQLNYADVESGIQYFKTLGDKFEIDSTPTVVIVNEKTKKGKQLHGVAEITPENITQAIDSLEK